MPSADTRGDGVRTWPDRPTRHGPGGEEGFKSRAGSGGDVEPTPGAGPLCVEDLLPSLRAALRDLYLLASSLEYNYYMLILRASGGVRARVLLYVGPRCLEVRGVALEACGESVEALKGLADRPEFPVVDVEGGCVSLKAPADPPYRVLRALRLAGVEEEPAVEGVEPVEELVGVEEEWFSVGQGSG